MSPNDEQVLSAPTNGLCVCVCVQLAQSNLGIAVHCPNFWLEMSWKFKPTDVSSAPAPEWRRSARSVRRGAALCQVTASCWYILLSSIMM